MNSNHEMSAWGRFWNRGTWWKALLAVAGYLVLYQLAAIGIARLVGTSVDLTDIFAGPLNVFLGLALPLIVGAAILLIFLASLRWIRPLFARQPINGRWWMWIFVALAIVPVVLRLFGIDYGYYSAGVVPMAFFAGIFIGFTEEVLYRGIVIKILRDAGHRELAVAVLSSLFFALSHSLNLLNGQPLLTVALTVGFTFGFGMMMYLTLRVTGHIIWPILLHALTDPTTFLGSGGIDVDGGAASSPLLSIAGPFSVVFFVAALIALIFIRGKVTSAPGDTGLGRETITTKD